MRGTHYVDICALNLHPPDLLFGTILLFSSFRDRTVKTILIQTTI